MTDYSICHILYCGTREKSHTPHLVCSCWGVQSHQESWCFQVWNGCSHPEEAVESESLCVLAQGQVVRLQWVEIKKKIIKLYIYIYMVH